MTAAIHRTDRGRWRLPVIVFLLLANLYMVTYSGRIETGDTLRLFNATASLVNFGDQYIDLAAWQFPPQQFSAEWFYPLQTANIEPMQVIAAAPLYWLAKHLPGFGMVHSVWLFNALVTAAAGAVLVVYARSLGATDRAAFLLALAFGAATAVWPYSKTFFREPLMLLLLLLSALFAERLRAGGYRSPVVAFAAIACLILLTLTKASALLALPALFIIAAPPLHRLDRRLIIGILLVAAALGGMFIALGILELVPALAARYDIVARLSEATSTYLGDALYAYLIAPGGSLWGTSPVLLLTLPGLIVSVRAGRWRYALAIATLVLAFAFGYAILNGVHWFGGLSWPPRFLIPVIPIVLVGALPIFERAAARPLSLAGMAVLAACVYGFWVQLSGVTLSWTVYTAALPPEANGLSEWRGGLADPAYFRWMIVPRQWGVVPFDIAWIEIGTPWIAVGFAALALSGLFAASRRSARWMFFLAAAFVILLIVGLRLLHDEDDRYLAGDETLFAMLPILEAETVPGDVILLSSPRYEPFFLNYGKLFSAGRVITLPVQPGERPSPEQPAELEAENPIHLLTLETVPLIYNLAIPRERLWLLVNGGPDLWWSTRPVERFLSTNYYPIRTIATAPVTRLIEYSTISAPDIFAFRSAEHRTDLRYGGQLALMGYELPAGSQLAPGAVLPVSLYWRGLEPIEANYTIALFLRAADGAPVAQFDSQPSGGFAPTSGWRPDVPVWDHRALRLPEDLPPGEYQLWVKVYDFDANGAPRDLTVTGAETIDGVIGVLPQRIVVGG